MFSNPALTCHAGYASVAIFHEVDSVIRMFGDVNLSGVAPQSRAEHVPIHNNKLGQ